MSDPTSDRLFRQLAAGGQAQQSAIDEIMRGGVMGEAAPAFEQLAESLRAEERGPRGLFMART